MVLDLGLTGDMNGFELLETVKANPAMARAADHHLHGQGAVAGRRRRSSRKFAETIIVKDVKSPERLLDETALFLHRVEARLPEQKRRMLERLHNTDAVFAGKRVLVVDDDVRNIFSLTSMLEEHGMNVSFAENGKDAIAILESTPDIDLVLMDVMMPEMDGYETTRAIRERPQFRAVADHRAHGEGDEGRSREVHRGGRIGLHHQAGRHRAAAQSDARMAVPVSPSEAEVERQSASARRQLDGRRCRTIRSSSASRSSSCSKGVFRHYGFDFRSYAYASIRRRLWKRIDGRAAELDRPSCRRACCTTRRRWSGCCSTSPST